MLYRLLMTAGLAVAMFGGTVHAAEPPESTGEARAAEVAESEPEALSLEELSDVRGGQVTVTTTIDTRTNQTLTASNRGNTVSADSVVTGDVTLDANAFDGFNGIGNFVINTGNNNNLQGALSVNIVTP